MTMSFNSEFIFLLAVMSALLLRGETAIKDEDRKDNMTESKPLKVTPTGIISTITTTTSAIIPSPNNTTNSSLIPTTTTTSTNDNPQNNTDDHSLCPPQLAGCHCNSTHVECVDTDFNNATFFLSIPHSVESVIVSGNNLTDLPANLFGACARNTTGRKYSTLKYLDLSSNGIQKLHGKTFHCLVQLETLILRDNSWKLLDINHTGVFEGLSNLRILDLDGALAKWSSPNKQSHLIRLPFVLNKTSTTLEDLNLANNEILTLTNESTDMLCNLQSLKRLNLSNNYLTEVRMDPCAYNLIQLDLSYNNIIFLGSFLTLLNQSMPNVTDLRLGHNNYMCNCYLIEFYEWLKANKQRVKDAENVVCADSYKDKYRGFQVLSLAVTDLKCEPIPNMRSLENSYIVMWLAFALIGFTALIVAYLNRATIKRIFKRCVAPYITPRTHYSYASIEI